MLNNLTINYLILVAREFHMTIFILMYENFLAWKKKKVFEQ